MYLTRCVNSNRLYTPDIILQRERQDRKYYPIASLHFCELRNSVPKSNMPQLSIPHSSDRRIRLFAVMNTSEPLTPMKSNGKSRREDSPQTIIREIDTAGMIVFDTSLSSNMTAGSRRMPHILDDKFGSDSASCATFMKETSELIIARTDGVFSYSVEDRGGAAGIEGYKECICAIGRYVLVCVADGDPHATTTRSTITIYDLRSKIISFYFSLPVGDRVLFCVQDGSMCDDSVCDVYYIYVVYRCCSCYYFLLAIIALYREGYK